MIELMKGGDQMKWEDVRQAFPNQWVLIEAIHAFTNKNSERILVEVAPLKKFSNSTDAMKSYKVFHPEDPTREMYVLHTSKEETNIIEKSG
jgi:hypothetical protein